MSDDIRYLYVMHSGSFIKIGISNDPMRRKRELNSGTKMPDEVSLLRMIKTPYYRKAEKILHHIYRNSHRRGEWYQLSPKEITCLSLLTSTHLKKLVHSPNQPSRDSLEEIVFGSQGMILRYDEPYTTVVERLKDKEIFKLEKEIDQLKKTISAYQRAGVEKIYKEENEDIAQSSIRTALKSIPTLK